MKKTKLIPLLALSILLCSSCGSTGISQEKYDSIVSEKDKLQEEYDILEKSIDDKIKIAEYKVALEKDYEVLEITLDMIETLGGDISESRAEFKQTYKNIKNELKNYKNDNSSDMSEIENKMNNWTKSVETIKEGLRNSFKTESIAPTETEETKQVADEKPKNTLLYEDEKVKIYFSKITSNGVEFIAENLTDINITIQADSISINGESTNDFLMSDDIAPQSKGKVLARCSDFASVSEVSTVGGQLRVIDFNDSFKSYSAIFVNVDVTQ